MKYFTIDWMIFRLLVFTVVVSFVFPGCKPEIVNLTDAKDRVKDYYESGKFDEKVNSIISEAIEKLEDITFTEHSTVIFDVDETALSNYEYTKRLGFGYTWQSWDKWVKSAKAKAIPGVKKLYDYLISRKVKVIFLTGRTAEQCGATKINLVNEGYTKFDTLICRKKDEAQLKTKIYKIGALKMLTKKNYRIIGCIGDQPTDINLDICKLNILIPNYLYKLD